MLARMGARVELQLEHVGFYPAGGGAIIAKIYPVKLGANPPQAFSLLERGVEGRHHVMIRRAHLPADIADREWHAVRDRLHWGPAMRRDWDHAESLGPGNSVHITLNFENVTGSLLASAPRTAARRLLVIKLQKRQRDT
jgi:RNA 3'-terminal phosphate cyclase (ATP)